VLRTAIGEPILYCLKKSAARLIRSGDRWNFLEEIRYSSRVAEIREAMSAFIVLRTGAYLANLPDEEPGTSVAPDGVRLVN
jgi:hypothetical protein